MVFRQLLIAFVALFSASSSLMAQPSLLQKVLANLRLTSAQPLTIKLIFPDNRIISLPAGQLSLFPGLKRIKQNNSCIHIKNSQSATDPFLDFNYWDVRAALEFVVFMHTASRKTDYDIAAMKEITFGNKNETAIRNLIHILQYLKVDPEILDCAFTALETASEQEESFLHDAIEGSLDLSNRWHPYFGWNVLNLSGMGITHLSDIPLALTSIPCHEVEELSLKDNRFDPSLVSAHDIDLLSKLFPRLKRIILY